MAGFAPVAAILGGMLIGLGWRLMVNCSDCDVPVPGLARPEPWIFTAMLVVGKAAAGIAKTDMYVAPLQRLV